MPLHAFPTVHHSCCTATDPNFPPVNAFRGSCILSILSAGLHSGVSSLLDIHAALLHTYSSLLFPLHHRTPSVTIKTGVVVRLTRAPRFLSSSLATRRDAVMFVCPAVQQARIQMVVLVTTSLSSRFVTTKAYINKVNTGQLP